MKLRNIVYAFFIIFIVTFLIIYAYNTIFVTPYYKYNLINTAKNYIKDKYNEDIKIEDVKYYSSSSGLLNINSIDEAIFLLDNDDYEIYYDLKNNSIYDSKQYKSICKAVKDNIILKNKLNNTYYINNFSVFEAETYHFNNSKYNIFFGKDSYFNGDIESFLNNNNINISLDIAFKNSPNVLSYRNICNSYINNLKPYFTGGESNIFIKIFKENYSNNKVIENSVCEIYSYQNKNIWFENTFEENFVKLSEGIFASSFINNYFFTSPSDCVFEELPVPDTFKELSPLDFDSNLYYFNYNEHIIHKYNIDTNNPLLIKLDRTIFEKGKLYNYYSNSFNYELYILTYNKPKASNSSIQLSYTLVDPSNSYIEGKYLYINMKPNSYLVLVKK